MTSAQWAPGGQQILLAAWLNHDSSGSDRAYMTSMLLPHAHLLPPPRSPPPMREKKACTRWDMLRRLVWDQLRRSSAGGWHSSTQSRTILSRISLGMWTVSIP